MAVDASPAYCLRRTAYWRIETSPLLSRTIFDMHPLRILLALVLPLGMALPLAADPLTDIRGALGKLTAREPIRATYEVQRTVVSEGKFDNDKVNGKAVVELEGSGGEFRVVIPKPLLEQIAREQ